MDLVLVEEYSQRFLEFKLQQLVGNVYGQVQQGESIEKTLQVVVGRAPE